MYCIFNLKDLANVAIKDADKLSLEEIRDVIKARSSSIKSKKGIIFFYFFSINFSDKQHNALVAPFKYMPSLYIKKRQFFL